MIRCKCRKVWEVHTYLIFLDVKARGGRRRRDLRRLLRCKFRACTLHSLDADVREKDAPFTRALFFVYRLRYGQFLENQSEKVGPAPGRYELSKGKFGGDNFWSVTFCPERPLHDSGTPNLPTKIIPTKIA